MSKNEEQPPLSVLIVEDDTYVAARLQSMLQDAVDHQLVGIVRNVSGALAAIRGKKPEVVLLDIHLEAERSGLNGIDLLKTLRNEHPDIIVIMMTNYSEPQYRQKCMELGANYFFDKTNEFELVPEILQKIHQSK